MKSIRRREFQQHLVDALESEQPIALDAAFFTALTRKSGWCLPSSELRELSRDWVNELIQERILLQTSDGKVQVNPEPIVGESARERLDKFPPDKIDRGAAALLLVLYAANAFLFLVLSFLFLPDSIVKVVGSAVGVALGLLGLKSLNPRETDSISLVERHRVSAIAALLVIALAQTILVGIGFANPCRIVALPGSTITVDGNFLALTPDPTQEELKNTADKNSPDNILPWLTPRETTYRLRWDIHTIRISKKWYVDTRNLSEELVGNVWVNPRKLWKLWEPRQESRTATSGKEPFRWNGQTAAFDHWIMKADQKPRLKISYGIKEQATEAKNLPETEELADDVQKAVEGWDAFWLTAMNQDPKLLPHNRTEKYVATLQVVQDHQTAHLELQIFDWTKQGLKPLRQILDSDIRADKSNTRLEKIRQNVFDQLLYELAIQGETITFSPETTAKVAAATPLFAPVDTVSVLPPAEGPSATPHPAATVTASAAPTSPATPTPNPIQVVAQLRDVATNAVNKNQLDVAVAVQQQLQTALDTVNQKSGPKQTTELVHDLTRAVKVINDAINTKGPKGRIYIYIANESQREPVTKKLQDELVENQFVVVGIQNVGGRAYIPDTAEVRFFAYPNPPTTKQSADTIKNILENNSVSKPRSSYVIPSKRDTTVYPDINTHFEIWFARDSFPEKD